MKDWYTSHPHLFHKRPYDRPGCDMIVIPALYALIEERRLRINAP